jgi:DNA-binding HxlR family transcriptional regulator
MERISIYVSLMVFTLILSQKIDTIWKEILNFANQHIIIELGVRLCKMPVTLQTTYNVLAAISDKQSLELFRYIAITNGNSDNLRMKINLTRKQYYSRLSRMTKAGLVKRKNGKHYLTAFGKVVNDAQTTIEKAVNSYWKLKAVDSLELSDELPKDERVKLIDNLLDNKDIKEILYSKL